MLMLWKSWNVFVKAIYTVYKKKERIQYTVIYFVIYNMKITLPTFISKFPV